MIPYHLEVDQEAEGPPSEIELATQLIVFSKKSIVVKPNWLITQLWRLCKSLLDMAP